MTVSHVGAGRGFRPNAAVNACIFFSCWVLVVILSLMGVATLTPEQSRPVLIPLAVILLVAGGFFLTITGRQRGATPIFHIGSFYAAIVLLYTVYPLLVYFHNGQTFGPLSDYRLAAVQPSAEQMGTLTWWYVIYLVTFCLIYLAMTRHVGSLRVQQPTRIGSLLLVTLTMYAGLELYLLILAKVFNIGPAETYYDTYLALRHLPLVVQQVTGRLQSWVPTLQILLLTILFTDYRRNRFYIALLLLWVGASTLMRMHARTELFLLILGATFLRHHMVRRMRVGIVVFGGALLLALFSVLGALRNIAATEVELSSMMWGTSEFEAIFANAYDLRFIRNDAGVFLSDLSLYLSDFTLFIPSQLLPFTKQTATVWYMDRYYPWVAAAGGGYAFGAIAEAIVGFGIIEAIVRGALLALIFGWIDRQFTSRRLSIWWAAFYVWLAVMAYMSFRTTTFSLITSTLHLFLVPVLVLQVSHALLVRFVTRKAAPARGPASVRVANHRGERTA